MATSRTLVSSPLAGFLDFYGLWEDPFGGTPDPRFLYLGDTHREALASLYYGVRAGLGFLALVAEPGNGKTTLLFHLLQTFRESDRTAFLFQTQCDSRELIRYLLAEIGVETPPADLVRLHEILHQELAARSCAGNPLILVVDEAQNLQPAVLETIRLLSNFESSSGKLLQIILAGQPQLADKIAHPALEQLRQRISMFIHLRPFDLAETGAYIAHRLTVAGYRGNLMFSDEALRVIHERSQGLPREINNYCHGALSLGFATGKRTIDDAMVREVAGDLDLSQWTTEGFKAQRPQLVSSPPIAVEGLSVPSRTATAFPPPSPPSAPAPDLPPLPIATATPAVQQPEPVPIATSAVATPAAQSADPSAAEAPPPPVIGKTEVASPPAADNSPAFSYDREPDPSRARAFRLRPAVFVAAALILMGFAGLAGAIWSRNRLRRAVLPEPRPALVAALPPASQPLAAAPIVPPATLARQPKSSAAPRVAPLIVVPEDSALASQAPAGSPDPPAAESVAKPSPEPQSSAPPASATELPGAVPYNQMAQTIGALVTSAPALPKPPAPPRRVSSGASQAVVIKRVDPEYPLLAARALIEGPVVLQAEITPQGLTRNVRVISGDKLLAPAALAAVKKWRYSPYILNGQPTSTQATITVNFTLKKRNL